MNALELFGHWKTVRHGLLEALDLLTDEQLAFVPREGLWSLGKVACHIAEAEEGWFRYAVSRELTEWPTFADKDEYSLEPVKALLSDVHDRTEVYLATVDAASLDRAIHTPWGEEIPLRWIIWHVLEHEVHHRGEIFLMLGLMGMKAPDI
jgi:uncharacterized damage-inducible protein DinB